MMVGERIRKRLAALTMSQAELARRVGLSQPAINALIRGASRSSTHLHKIARELRTTPSYLSGEIDDPEENAPPPAPTPTVQFVTMQVALPPQPALARMFEALLRMMPDGASIDERAQLLASRLPIGLSQLRDLLPTGPVIATPAATLAESPPTHVPERQS